MSVVREGNECQAPHDLDAKDKKRCASKEHRGAGKSDGNFTVMLSPFRSSNTEGSDRKTFKCPLCVDTFVQFSKLKRHLLTMHPRRERIMEMVHDKYENYLASRGRMNLSATSQEASLLSPDVGSVKSPPEGLDEGCGASSNHQSSQQPLQLNNSLSSAATSISPSPSEPLIFRPWDHHGAVQRAVLTTKASQCLHCPVKLRYKKKTCRHCTL